MQIKSNCAPYHYSKESLLLGWFSVILEARREPFCFFIKNLLDFLIGFLRSLCSLMLTLGLYLFIIIFPFISLAQGINSKSSFMQADFIEYNEQENFIYAKGNIKITLNNYVLIANSVAYDIEKDLLWAQGNIKIKEEGNKLIFGETAILKDKLKAGIISDFILSLGNNTLLVAKLAERVDENKIRLYKSSFTPCEVVCDKKPIWQISAKKTEVDFDQDKIVYKHLFFEVYGIPVFFIPYFSHPTPAADAKSGVLVPSIKNKGLGIPLYVRAKPNMDFTLTPVFFQEYSLFELEARYKPIKNSDIIFQSSYGKAPYFIEKDGKKIKSKKVNSYHFLTYGNFHNDLYKYGFKIERTSDKAYLKNYYRNYTPYLISKLYFNKVTNYNYYSVEGLTFQDLRANEISSNDLLVLPKLQTKNIINLNEEETSYLVIGNNTLAYKEQQSRALTRTSLNLAWVNNFITPSGQLLNVVVRNRGDLALTNHLNKTDPKANEILYRTIPELQTIWRYPLITSFHNYPNITIEPIISLTFGRKIKANDRKFTFIDSSKYELSENNIFLSNRYSGIDYHEFGNRVSYGINSSTLVDQTYLSLFIGQSANSSFNIDDKTGSNIENVGKVFASLNELELFYRFRKDNKLAPIRDEIGVDFHDDRFQLEASFIQLMNLSKYYTAKNIMVDYNKTRQLYYSIGYQITENWLINYTMHVNLSRKHPNIFSKSIKVTYLKDCVKIAAKISDDYMSDGKRGIRKSSFAPTISVGLKILNM